MYRNLEDYMCYLTFPRPHPSLFGLFIALLIGQLQRWQETRSDRGGMKHKTLLANLGLLQQGQCFCTWDAHSTKWADWRPDPYIFKRRTRPWKYLSDLFCFFDAEKIRISWAPSFFSPSLRQFFFSFWLYSSWSVGSHSCQDGLGQVMLDVEKFYPKPQKWILNVALKDTSWNHSSIRFILWGPWMDNIAWHSIKYSLR